VQDASRRALVSSGFASLGDDRYSRPIESGLAGIVSLRAPAARRSSTSFDVIAISGVRVRPLEQLYDEIASGIGLRWYAADPYRASFQAGFSEAWTFERGGDLRAAVERLTTTVCVETSAAFRRCTSVESALEAIASREVVSRFDYESIPLSLALLGRRDAARTYLEEAPRHFACDDDAAEYRRFAEAVVGHLARSERAA